MPTITRRLWRRWLSDLNAPTRPAVAPPRRVRLAVEQAEDRLAPSAAFAAGDLVVYRVGTGTGALSSVATAVFLDEYTPSGTLVQSIPLPTADTGTTHILTASGSATSEGLLTLSADGRYILLTGYDAATGTTGVASTASATTARVVGRVDAQGNVDTTTALNLFSANNIRSAASANGTDIWVTGANGGVNYTTLGSTAATAVSTTVANLRQTEIYAGQLYISTSSGTAVRIGSVGTGTPTTTGQTTANLPGYSASTGSPYAFFFADLSASVPGVDTLYVADDTPGTIQKYSFDGTNWSAKGTISATTARGITGVVNGSAVTLYVTNGTNLSTLVDTSGYNATITGTLTSLAAAATNTAIRGVAFVPQSDLTASVSGPATATAGTAYDYTILIGNAGSSVSGVSASFTLPAGVTYNSATASGFSTSQSGGVVTFTGGSIPGGGSVMLTVNVTPTGTGTVTLPAGAAVADPSNAIAESNETNNSSTQTVSTSVTGGATNHPPVITSNGAAATAAVSVAENTTAVTTVTATDPDSDPVTYSLDNTSPDFAKFAINSSTGVLTFVTAPNFEVPTDANTDNKYQVTVVAKDPGGLTGTQAITVTVTDVNEAPVFTLGGDPPASNEDGGAQTLTAFLTNIKTGPDPEAGQAVSFVLTAGATTGGLTFTSGPMIDASGNLTYTATPNANGTATFSVVAMDNGPTGGSNVNTSAPQTFTITVNAVNDAPSFGLSASTIAVNENAGTVTIPNFATAISAGPPDEAGQTLSFNISGTNAGLYSVIPQISSNGTLTFTPAPGVTGSGAVFVSLMDDGGTANGGSNLSATQMFTINVVAPTATTTTVTATGGGTVTYGTAVTLTATVTAASGTTAPTAGSVSFFDNGALIGTATTIFSSGSGFDTFQITTTGTQLKVNGGMAHTLSAVYTAGSGFADSDSATTGGNATKTIAPFALTVSGITAANKVYDGGFTAALNAGGAMLSAPFSGDMVSLVTTGATGAFVSKDVATGITVNMSGLTLAGGDAGNYSVAQPTTSANITPATLTVSGVTAANKVYDGGFTAMLSTGSAMLVGVFGTDMVSLVTSGATGTFASKDVANGITVTVSGLTLTGAQAGDYVLTQPTATANITPATLTVTGVTASNKVYDSTKTATLSTASAMLVGVFGTDMVSLVTTGATGMFASKDVATGITVNMSGLTLAGGDAGNYSVAQPTTSANITPATLTVSGVTAANKVYDGGFTAMLSTGSAMLVGVFAGETVSLVSTGATGTFATKDVGTGIAVSVAGLTLGGAQGGDYVLTQPTATANITPATLTVTGVAASNKVYDGGFTAMLNTAGAMLVGVFGTDMVSLVTTGATGTFASKDVANGIAVNVSGLTLSGAQAGDYVLTQPTTTANITPATLTVSGVTAANKVYDSTKTAVLSTGSAMLVGVIGTDMVSLVTSGATGTFASKDVANGITVTVSGLTLTGAQAGDYVLTQPTATANITPATLTVTGVAASNKVYDSTKTATLGTASAMLVGVFGTDMVSLVTTGATGAFATKDVANGIAVTVSGLALAGAQAGDYVLTQPTATANITPATLTITGVTANNKVYDSTTAATLNTGSAVASGVFAGDGVTPDATAATGTFKSKDVGTGILVTVSGLALAGSQAGDYVLTQPTATANITPATLTVTGVTASDKVYDSTTAASLDTSAAALVGVFMGDAVGLTTGGAAGAFATKDVGTGLTVSVSGLALAGAQAGDYVLTQPTTTASITPATLTITGVTASDKVYDGTPAASVDAGSAVLVGVFSGDVVTPDGSGATGTFATKDVGTGLAVFVSGLTLGGAQAGDYVLTQPTTTANITPKAITVGGVTASDKVYDGTTTATLNTTAATASGVVAGDDATLTTTGAAGTFATKNVGSGLAVAVSGLALSGGDAGNYTLTQPATTASITPAPLTVTGVTAAGKVYDGTTTATVNATGAALAGAVMGDAVTLTGTAAGTFATRNVGVSVAVAVSGLSLGGSAAGNYALTLPTVAASIAPRPITVTAATNSKPFDGKTTASAAPTVTAGSLAAGDTAAFTEAYDTAVVGAGKTLTPAGAVADGNGGNNYAVTFVPVATGEITKRDTRTTDIAVAVGTGVVKLSPQGTVEPLPSPIPNDFGGGVRVSMGDVTGDGVPDMVVGTGPGRASEVDVYDGLTGNKIASFQPFEASFTGGVFVVVGDMDNDGKADIVVTPDQGGGPRVTVYSGADRHVLANFFGIDDQNFRGGARAAIGDLNADGQADLIVVAGFGGGPRVSGYEGKSVLAGTPQHLFHDFFVFEQTLRNGVYVTAGDLDGDGYDDLIVGGGPGGGPRVFALSGHDLVSGNVGTASVLANFFAGDPNDRDGVQLTVKNLDGDDRADIVAGTGSGPNSRVTAYVGTAIAPSGQPAKRFDTNVPANYLGGVYVG